MSTIPLDTWSQAFSKLVDETEDAFIAGMYNGRAKGFVSALLTFLMAEAPGGVNPKFFLHERYMTTETSDTVVGRVRYVKEHTFETS